MKHLIGLWSDMEVGRYWGVNVVLISDDLFIVAGGLSYTGSIINEDWKDMP